MHNDQTGYDSYTWIVLFEFLELEKKKKIFSLFYFYKATHDLTVGDYCCSIVQGGVSDYKLRY